jgi:hypothetical protein
MGCEAGFVRLLLNQSVVSPPLVSGSSAMLSSGSSRVISRQRYTRKQVGANMARESLEKLIGLFNLKKKKEVERYCRKLVITSEDLADLILAGRVGGFGPLRYACHFAETRPEHLEPRQAELAALASNGVGSVSGAALKAVRKMNQLFNERSLLSTHLFYEPSQKYWHMFYFDQRDFTDRKNHWKQGPHIHYSQDMFTKEPLALVWSSATSDKPEFPPSVHVRYDYHHNRTKRS